MNLISPNSIRFCRRASLLALLAGCLSACTLPPNIQAKVLRKGAVSNEMVPLQGPEVVLSYDVDMDGFGDVVITTASGITVFLYNSSAQTTGAYTYTAVDIPTPWPLAGVKGGRFDRNEFKDLVARAQTGAIVVINDPSGTGAPPPAEIVTGPVVPQPTGFCAGDFDGDGDDDLACCLESDPDHTAPVLSIVLNNTPEGENTEPGDWTESQRVERLPAPPVATSFASVCSGRLNADADPDLLVCESSACYALAGNGDGTFDPIDPVTGAVIDGGAIQAGTLPGISLASAAYLADFDQDGDSDLMVLRFSNPPIVRFNTGNGVFGPSQTFTGGIPNHSVPVFVDIDQNGTTDIATLVNAGSTTETSNYLCITKVNSNGTLQPTTIAPTINQPSALAPFEPEPNDAPGLLVGSFLGQRLTLHRSIDGNPTSFQRYMLGGTGGGRSVAAGDLTGDGYPDVYMLTMSSQNQVLVNRGDGSGLVDATPIPGAPASNAELITFIERPGRSAGTIALAFAPTSRLLFSNIIAGPQFRFNEVQLLPATPRDIVKGDFNADGLPDALVLLDTPNPGIAISYQDATGAFGTPAVFNLTAGTTPQGWWTHAAPIDLESQGDDFAVYGPGGAGVFRISGTGFDFFPAFGTGFAGGVRVATGDLNGDGTPDLAVARDLGSNNGAVTLALSTNPGGPTPTFAAPVTINLFGAPRGLALTDLDHDDDLDIAAACNTGGTTQLHWTILMLNDGQGGFPDAGISLHLAGATPRHLIAADLHNPEALRRGASLLPATAGEELIIASGGPGATNFEGVQVLMNLTDFAATPPACPGDADGNGAVNFADITSVLTFFGTDYTPGTGPGDADHNGPVNFADITSVLTFFGLPCS